jgi:hypothetical protein
MEQMAEIDARVREALLAEPIDSMRIDQRVRESIRPSRHWVGIAVGIAAGLAIAVVVLQYSAPNRTCAAAALDHHREIVTGEHRTWLLDPASIAGLAERQGVSFAQFAPADLRLERGKLCRLNGRVFLHLVYSDGSGEVSLFLRQHEQGSPAAIRNADSGSEHVAYFDTPRVDAIVVSNESSESAKRIAQLAERAL